MSTDGTYLELDGHPAVRFERRYPHSTRRVWQAIVDPDESRHWFPSKLVIARTRRRTRRVRRRSQPTRQQRPGARLRATAPARIHLGR